jgi:hypothetical protein
MRIPRLSPLQQIAILCTASITISVLVAYWMGGMLG